MKRRAGNERPRQLVSGPCAMTWHREQKVYPAIGLPNRYGKGRNCSAKALPFFAGAIRAPTALQMLRPRDLFLLHRLIEQFFEIVVQTVEIGPFSRRDNRVAFLVFGRKQRGQFGLERSSVPPQTRQPRSAAPRSRSTRLHLRLPRSIAELIRRPVVMTRAATITEIAPASR